MNTNKLSVTHSAVMNTSAPKNPRSSWKRTALSLTLLGTLLISGCNAATLGRVVATGTAVTLALELYVMAQEVKAANLDVEKKQLEIEAIKKNGEEVSIIKSLTSDEIRKIMETREIEVKLEDGSTVTMEVNIESLEEKKTGSTNYKIPSSEESSAAEATESSQAQKIRNLLDNSSVDFTGENGSFAGQVSRAWVRSDGKVDEKGAAAKIKWEDDVTSSILFLDNGRVRVWEKGIEYGGTWSLSSGSLTVRMDKGARYSFGS